MSKETLKVWRMSENAVLPKRMTEKSVGYDLYATKDYEFDTGDLCLVETDLVMSVPDGYHLELVLRSSLTKRGLMLANSVGIIDGDFKGENDRILVALCKCHNGTSNMSRGRGYGVSTQISTPTKISAGERIAQIIIRKSNLLEVEDMTGKPFEATTRGGFGSTNER